MGVPENESAEVGMGVSVGGNGEYVGNRMGANDAVGVAICVSAFAVPTMSETVSVTCFGCVLGVGSILVQEVSSSKARRKDVIALPGLFIFLIPLYTLNDVQQFPFSNALLLQTKHRMGRLLPAAGKEQYLEKVICLLECHRTRAGIIHKLDRQ